MAQKHKVAVVMGSNSDMEIMKNCVDTLKGFGINADVRILSAHRTPKRTIEFASNARKNNYQLIIAAAGGAAHLAGVAAAHTTLPVIGVPMDTKALGGLDSLFSTVQMPSGIPVACMAIGRAGAINAAVLAIEILALNDNSLRTKLDGHKIALAKSALKK
ncbi:MAG: 5-(carboxyamino)imidazole ribonucleotide mutase [Candidatus Omnitrophica bacterium]|jgi:phosphoribosylaminoimidazole carboxylase PurE protein|nr:5-(carboxyamino)imidazole ribonucleotide mutase [Candidatus Omnitrophota bacterium]